MQQQSLPTKITLTKNNKIAYICSPRIGDTLIGLVLAHNLLCSGYKVDVYGGYAVALAAWFPHMLMKKMPAIDELSGLKKYDFIIHMYPSDCSKELERLSCKHSYVLTDWPFNKRKKLMVDIQLDICAELLGLSNLIRSNGIAPLTGLVKAKYDKRIVVHPGSASMLKNWPLEKFFMLAQTLRDQGWDVYFIVGPNENKYAEKITTNDFKLASFAGSLSELSAFIYESAYFIGNDSGCSHLASNLGLPTLTFMMRRGVARQWSPSFSPGKIILAPAWVNPKLLREKFWSHFVTVRMALKAFLQLCSK